MNGMLELMMRGLLVLALAGGVIACSDDDGDDMADATGGSESGGTDETGGMGATGGTMDLTAAQCMDMTSTLLPDACKTCLCDELPNEVAACNDACVTLINCVGNKCPGMTDDTSCTQSMCGAEILATGDLAAATTKAGPAFEACATECQLVPIDEDAGM